MLSTSRALLVVCPAFNEAESIGQVVRAIHAANSDVTVLVVDDGSTDGTAAVARAAKAKVFQLPFNVGVGGALRVGLLFGTREGYAAVVQCDADGQHPPTAIPQLVAALDRADLVVGARFAGVGNYSARGPRRWAMRLLARVLSRVHHTPLTDVTSGFRAFGPRAMKVLSTEMPPEYLGDTVDALMIAKSTRLKVIQVPVEMLERTAGIPTHRPVRAAFYLARAGLILSLSLLRLVARRKRSVR